MKIIALIIGFVFLGLIILWFLFMLYLMFFHNDDD